MVEVDPIIESFLAEFDEAFPDSSYFDELAAVFMTDTQAGELVGELSAEGRLPMLLAVNIDRCIAFVQKVDPVEVRIGLLPDSEALSLAKIYKSFDRYITWDRNRRSSMRVKSPESYLREFPERGAAFGLGVDEAEGAKADLDVKKD